MLMFYISTWNTVINMLKNNKKIKIKIMIVFGEK